MSQGSKDQTIKGSTRMQSLGWRKTAVFCSSGMLGIPWPIAIGSFARICAPSIRLRPLGSHPLRRPIEAFTMSSCIAMGTDPWKNDHSLKTRWQNMTSKQILHPRIWDWQHPKGKHVQRSQVYKSATLGNFNSITVWGCFSYYPFLLVGQKGLIMADCKEEFPDWSNTTCLWILHILLFFT